MSTRYYELRKQDSPDEWHLRLQGDSRGNELTKYRWSDVPGTISVFPPLQLTVGRLGTTRDFSLDIVTCAPILSGRAAETIKAVADGEVDLIAANIARHDGEFFSMIVRQTIRCVDEQRSHFVEKWTSDSFRPDRVGEYKILLGIVIETGPALGHHIFRLWGSPQHVIVSETVKHAFEMRGLSGAKFVDVSPVVAR